MAEKKLRNDLKLSVINLMVDKRYTEDRLCRLVRLYYREGLVEQEDGEFIQTLIEGEDKNGY